MLLPIEKYCLEQCMANNARLQQLGLPPYNPNGTITPANSKDKNKTKQRYRKDPDYGPLQDDTGEQDDAGEQDSFDDEIAKGSKTSKITKRQTSDAAPIGVKFRSRSRKRVYAAATPTTTTGPSSNRSISLPNASLSPSDIHVPPSSHSASHSTGSKTVGPADQDDGVDAIMHVDGHNNLGTIDGLDLHDDNNTMVAGADVIAPPVGDNQMTNEGGQELWNRGVNMGHGLNRMNRSHLAKLPIVILEGQIRPVVPFIAAKYATEINIAVRNHVPMLTHWKLYKHRPAVIETFFRILRAKFNIDTNDAVVKNGCLEMMKSAVRQQQHNLKKDFFDPFPLHLTEMETQLAAQPTEGEQPKSVLQVVANVLERNNKKSVFLQNVGMQTKRPRLSAQLEAEKRENAELRLIVNNQREQMEGLSKKRAELEAKLDLALGQNRP
ncbi:hypothetical protein PVAP13_1KG199330 [Panicum virgatum]|uniref:Uncharacterized protein n=1 Tax=Panicum virgatum TaxID=38727 RepID=A0A8T0X7Q9_PANVG|nr:hypothetical protein PVAP13_1KG199330 [Panicum virgatum]